MKFMRRNKLEDPLAEGDKCNAISARCDLNPMDSHVYDCFGGHDSKVTAWRGPESTGNLSFYGVLSPTFDDEKPFSWSSQNASVDTCRPTQHVGHPDTFNFGWHTFPSAVETDAALGFPLARNRTGALFLYKTGDTAQQGMLMWSHALVPEFNPAQVGCLFFLWSVAVLGYLAFRRSRADDGLQGYISIES